MGDNQIEEFDKAWNLSLKNPFVKPDIVKVDVDLSIDTYFKKFLIGAEKWLNQGKIEKNDYQELVSSIKNLTTLMKKMTLDNLIEQSKSEERSQIKLKTQY